jgi:hypothetical protein
VAPDAALAPVSAAEAQAAPAAPDAVVQAAPGESVVFAVPVFRGSPGVPAGLGAFAEPVAPGEQGALVGLAAPAGFAAPVAVAGPARLAWFVEPAGQCVPLVPAFLLEGDAMVWESAVDAAVQQEPGLVHAARREEAGS